MKKTDRSVVRNVSYTRNKVNNMERHNERKNKSYNNENVRLECSALNVHYKDCQGEYLQCFDRMVSEGVISLRGLKKDAKVIDEMIFDVNSEYFERHGGYEYAKQFFQEAYQMAVKEIGGEQYILSAVMHADEKTLSCPKNMVMMFSIIICTLFMFQWLTWRLNGQKGVKIRN